MRPGLPDPKTRLLTSDDIDLASLMQARRAKTITAFPLLFHRCLPAHIK